MPDSRAVSLSPSPSLTPLFGSPKIPFAEGAPKLAEPATVLTAFDTIERTPPMQTFQLTPSPKLAATPDLPANLGSPLPPLYSPTTPPNGDKPNYWLCRGVQVPKVLDIPEFSLPEPLLPPTVDPRPRPVPQNERKRPYDLFRDDYEAKYSQGINKRTTANRAFKKLSKKGRDEWNEMAKQYNAGELFNGALR